MSVVEENIELKKKKKFYLYKRSLLFSSIFSIFIFMATVTSLSFLRVVMMKDMDIILFISIVTLVSFILKFSLRSFQYRLNKIGVYLIEALIVAFIIHFILRIEFLLGL